VVPGKTQAGPTGPTEQPRARWEMATMTMTMATPHTGTVKTLPGVPYPLDSAYDGNGTNFSIFSEVAERVELCLFHEDGKETRVNLDERDGYNWHVYLSGVHPGQQYGYRVHGPWDPQNGIRCCPSKLLLDPNAKAVSGSIQWSDALYPYRIDKADPTMCSNSDDAPLTLKSVVHNPYFHWDNEYRGHTPLEDTVIYELHVKGFTQRHPAIPPELRGTYAGVAHPAAIEYLKSLGITAVELLPVHQFVHDRILIDKGLRNYWGYNSICYFAPHNEYSSSGDRGQQVQEFKQMVYNLHEAGIEVILDVVYNHTAEGNHLGPMFNLKGIDNPAYYRLKEDDPQYYMDYTGTGNSLNMRHPAVLQLIMDSLRYWITDVRARQVRNLLATLLLSQGVPMILSGDESGRTQKGNNNAYCQDNELSWFDWEHADKNLLEFTTQLIHLRRDHPVLHRRGWYQGRSIRGSAALDDIGWFRPDGTGMSTDDWKQGYIKVLQIFLNGDLGYVDRRGEPVQDDDFLLLVNAHHEDALFHLALAKKERPWQIVLNTSTRIEDGEPGEKQSDGLQVKAEGRSVIVLTRPCHACGRTEPF
jgi:pullulanase/glycogen debranching enzyme